MGNNECNNCFDWVAIEVINSEYMKCMDRNILLGKNSSKCNEVKFDALLYTMRVTMSEAINLLFLINRYI